MGNKTNKLAQNSVHSTYKLKARCIESILDLPNELLFSIFLYCKFQTILILERTCQNFHDILRVNSKLLYQTLSEQLNFSTKEDTKIGFYEKLCFHRYFNYSDKHIKLQTTPSVFIAEKQSDKTISTLVHGLYRNNKWYFEMEVICKIYAMGIGIVDPEIALNEDVEYMKDFVGFYYGGVHSYLTNGDRKMGGRYTESVKFKPGEILGVVFDVDKKTLMLYVKKVDNGVVRREIWDEYFVHDNLKLLEEELIYNMDAVSVCVWFGCFSCRSYGDKVSFGSPKIVDYEFINSFTETKHRKILGINNEEKNYSNKCLL